MSLIRRKIDMTFQLGKGNFGADTGDTVTLSGLRCSANIEKAGDPGFDTANLRVWGLKPSLMNQLTTLGKPLEFFRDNVVSVSAGDEETGMGLVFTGTIDSAYQDFEGAPEAALNIRAFVGLIVANRPVPPSSFQGSADAATIMSGLALQAGLAFENNGVSVQLSNPYFPGTARAQMQAVARAANIFFTIDGSTVAIWPKDGRRGGLVPEISPEGGMVGYPRWTQGGIGVRILYRPGLIFGGEVQVRSSIEPASGRWIINRLSHSLESEMPNGQWFTDFEAYRYENVDG
jgi:hypothetical protein